MTIEKGRNGDQVKFKGTIDAVACSKNPEIPQKMMREMARVTSQGCIFVSHSGPEKRNFLFRDLKVEVAVKVKKWIKLKKRNNH